MFRDNYSRLYITVLFLMDKKIGAGLKKKNKKTHALQQVNEQRNCGLPKEWNIAQKQMNIELNIHRTARMINKMYARWIEAKDYTVSDSIEIRIGMRRRKWQPTPVSLPRKSQAGVLQSMGSQRVGEEWAANSFTFKYSIAWGWWCLYNYICFLKLTK